MPCERATVLTLEADPARGGVQAWGHGIALALARRVPTRRLPSRGASWRELFGWAAIPAAGRREAVVFLVRDHFKYLPFLTVRMLLGWGPRLVLIVHGNELLRMPAQERSRLRCLQAAGLVVIANCRATAAILADLTGIPPTEVIPPCLPLPPPLAREPGPPGRVRLIALGRLVRRKNIQGCLEALAVLLAEGVDATLAVVGEGPEGPALRRAALPLGDRVEFHGRVDASRKQALLAGADLLLLPSLHLPEEGSIEGYGMVFIEANAAGVPVLAGLSGGMPEAVIDGVTGVLCDGSPAGIAAAIQRALAIPFDPARLRAHAAAHDVAAQDRLCDLILGAAP